MRKYRDIQAAEMFLRSLAPLSLVLHKVAFHKKGYSNQNKLQSRKELQMINISPFNRMSRVFYCWLKAESQDRLLINQSSSQRNLQEAKVARRKLRVEGLLQAEDVLEAAGLLRILQASRHLRRLPSQRS
jgi:hypothetical protein